MDSNCNTTELVAVLFLLSGSWTKTLFYIHSMEPAKEKNKLKQNFTENRPSFLFKKKVCPFSMMASQDGIQP